MELQSEFNKFISRLAKNAKDIDAFDSAIKAIVQSHPLHAESMRTTLRRITELSLSDIKKCEKSLSAIQATHSQIANDFLQSFGELSPVGSNGCLWIYNQHNGLWEDSSLQTIAAQIGRNYSTHSKCVKHGDYKSLANLIYDEVFEECFFNDAVRGVNTPSGFYTIEKNSLIRREASAIDKARFKLNIDPQADCEMNEFMGMLKHAFGSSFEQQIRQLRMFFGLSLIGMQSSLQRVCFLKGPGGSGKSTILRILEALVPPQHVSHVSPLELNCDYKKAALADKLLNLVPEIEQDKVIPSAPFKAVTGEDSTIARQPYGRVFNFKSEAGNWFNGNFFITTRDHSDGFYRRWAIIKFFNAKPLNERDYMLTQRIVENELSGILAWAFDGVRDYLSNGLYLSTIHYATMAEWKTEGNSALNWLNDEENRLSIRVERDRRAPLSRTKAYRMYSSWCYSCNKTPFSKKYFYMFLEEKGLIATKYNGYDCYCTLTIEINHSQ